MVRVLIDRRVSEGMEGDFHQLLRRMRLEAVQQPGYISGESWRDAADPLHYVVISTWATRRAWDHWAESEVRRATMAVAAALLAHPETVTVLEPL